MSREPTVVTSRDNPLVKDLKRLAQDNAAYRKLGQVWVEGDHLCRAVLDRGWMPETEVFSEAFWARKPATWATVATKTVVMPHVLMKEFSGLESPAHMGFVVNLPPMPSIDPDIPTVILDRVQDAGNVGSILRSAVAFGFRQIIALKGTAALWSPKVLRAGMGAHFANMPCPEEMRAHLGLRLIEGAELQDLAALTSPLLVTSSHQGDEITQAPLPWPCAWVFGHEGQGVAPELMERANQSIRIDQPGGEESLNVAAAAAICLHASSGADWGTETPSCHRLKSPGDQPTQRRSALPLCGVRRHPYP